MSVNKYYIVLLFLIISLSHSKIILSNQFASNKPNQDNILQFPYIEVDFVHKKMSHHNVQILYCRLKVQHKNKKLGYEDFLKDYNQIVKQLIQKSIVPNKQMMVHSSLRIKYNNRRRWEFVRHFVVVVTNDERYHVIQILKRNKAIHLKEAPAIRYLNEKYRVLEAFHLAKLQLKNYLQTLQKNRQLEIKRIQEIQIQGNQLKNREIIQSELQYQANNSEPQVVFGNVKKFQKTQYYREEGYDDKIQIRVLFVIGQKINDFSEDQITDEDLDEESVSEDEQQDVQYAGEDVSLFDNQEL